jgi:ABC-type antimicrobial peptide transport system permease subunit
MVHSSEAGSSTQNRLAWWIGGSQSILFQMTGADPTLLALSADALALVALGAGFIPAHRASRVDPIKALNYE